MRTQKTHQARTKNQPNPQTQAGKLLELLLDGGPHDTAELRTALSCTKGTLSSALYQLRYYYLYLIEAQTEGDHKIYTLKGRSEQPSKDTPALGTALVVRGVTLTETGEVHLVLSDHEGTQWRMTVVQTPVSAHV